MYMYEQLHICSNCCTWSNNGSHTRWHIYLTTPGQTNFTTLSHTDNQTHGQTQSHTELHTVKHSHTQNCTQSNTVAHRTAHRQTWSHRYVTTHGRTDDCTQPHIASSAVNGLSSNHDNVALYLSWGSVLLKF